MFVDKYSLDGAVVVLRLIPVVDILGGTVVRAVRGDRASYRPMLTTLCPGSAPVDVVAALLDLYPFDHLYIADLDSIQGCGDNLAVIESIHRRFPGLDIWADTGIASVAGLVKWQARELGTAVIGSESVSAHEFSAGIRDPAVLSLDFRGDRFIGPAALLSDVSLWPGRIIAMTLARVGAGLGPDLERLSELIKRAKGREIYSAGGVRHAADLDALARCGAAGVLLASALHDGILGHAELARWTRSEPG
ncbi:MAG: histidine biosynthesis protein [Betaproteobacteria bacterium]|nr:histidine biosynthesis protein [Betaproteobacteria bacterium]